MSKSSLQTYDEDPSRPFGLSSTTGSSHLNIGEMENWKLTGGMTLNVYVVGPEDAKLTVVVAPDMLSIHSGSLKSFCDDLAYMGYRVMMPDLHSGKSLKHDFKQAQLG
jgi:hypothetical protein